MEPLKLFWLLLMVHFCAVHVSGTRRAAMLCETPSDCALSASCGQILCLKEHWKNFHIQLFSSIRDMLRKLIVRMLNKLISHWIMKIVVLLPINLHFDLALVISIWLFLYARQCITHAEWNSLSFRPQNSRFDGYILGFLKVDLTNLC